MRRYSKYVLLISFPAPKPLTNEIFLRKKQPGIDKSIADAIFASLTKARQSKDESNDADKITDNKGLKEKKNIVTFLKKFSLKKDFINLKFLDGALLQFKL